jgi:hypothetical protein
MRDLITENLSAGNIIVFRQSLNLFSKNWGVVKYNVAENAWPKLDYPTMKLIVNKMDGYKFAIHNLRWLIDKIMGEKGRPVWTTSKVGKQRITISGFEYSVFKLVCHRIKYDISGVV